MWIRSDKARRPFQQGPEGQSLQGPDFLMSALPRANTFFGLLLLMMSALEGRWTVLIRAGNKVNIGPIPALQHNLISSPLSGPSYRAYIGPY